MDPAQFFAASRVLIVAGKGGVGKSTVSAALARAAARAGRSTLVVGVEGTSGVSALFGRPPSSYDEVVLHPGGGPEGAADVRGRLLTPDDALVEYLEDHGLHRVTRRLLSGGALDVVATAAPGIKDILVLGKVKQLERAGVADLIVLDAPAAGHAITFLRSARGLLDAARVGPINTQAAEVLEMLTDPERCQVVLVTLPEETPVNELVDTAYSLEDEVGVSLGPVVVNGLYPPIDGPRRRPGRSGRRRRHRHRRRRAGGDGRGGALPVRAGPPPGRPGGAPRGRSAPAAAAAALPLLLRPRPHPPRGPRQRGRARHRGPRRAPRAMTPPSVAPEPPADDPLGALLDRHAVVVCTGSGGVGKTTTAAVLAMEAAHRGRRACVVTIDPARRLADAMGLAGLTDTPARVEGPWSGELWATMLDTKATFDALVHENAGSEEQATAILENRFYRNISGSLSGTQEYMAMEKLFELHAEERFDLVVVDTPPTRNALDFLEAPRRLTRFLDHRLYRMLIAPSRGLARAVNVAAQTFLRTISRVVGAEVVQDAIGFFAAFDGMEAGFRDRAEAVTRLLTSDETAFVMITAPSREVVAEATFFADKLAEADIAVRALVVNRVHPRFADRRPEAASRRADALADTPLAPFARNLADFALLAGTEDDHLAGLTGRVAPAPVVRVPFLDTDVHDLDGLDRIAAHLFPDAARRAAG